VCVFCLVFVCACVAGSRCANSDTLAIAVCCSELQGVAVSCRV